MFVSITIIITTLCDNIKFEKLKKDNNTMQEVQIDGSSKDIISLGNSKEILNKRHYLLTDKQ